MKQANIYRENGTLIIDFRKPKHKFLYRDVLIKKTGDCDEIMVTGNKANFVKISYSLPSRYMDIDPYTDTDKVLPEYVEIHNPGFWERFWNFSVDKLFDNNVVKRLKEGWVELKKTNEPFKAVTTKYIIYESED